MRPNSTSTNYYYDGVGRLTDYYIDFTTNAHDIHWNFAYNPASQITTMGASSTVYDYKETITNTDNRTYDGLNRDATIAAIGGYDARQNLISEGTGTGARQFTYDIENRLLTERGGNAPLDMVYDPEGRLAKYSTDSGSTYTSFLYDGVNLIAEYDNSGVVLKRYMHGLGTDQPLVEYTGTAVGASNANYLYSNYQGSVIATADMGGTVGGIYKYGPYGEPKNAANADDWSTTGQRFRYTGQIMLPEARLYYYKARVYDPKYGRFLQTDPIGSKDDLDLYAYVGGDPVNATDPTGNDTHVMFPSEVDKMRNVDSKHTAVMTDTGKGLTIDGVKMDSTPALYDSSGHQEMIEANGPGLVAESDQMRNMYSGPDISVNNYVETQFKEYKNIGAVVVVNIPTTPGQEGQIVQKALNTGPGNGVSCTWDASKAISGVGKIPNMTFPMPKVLPNDLRNTLTGKFGSTTYYRDGRSVVTKPNG